MAKEYLNAFINNSSTVREKLGADIANAPHKAVAYNENGDIVLAATGEGAIGILLGDTRQEGAGGTPTAKAGQEADVLIKHIGLLEAGGAIAKGAAVTINASGQGITATAGEFVFGFAFTAASAAGELVQVQITRSGAVSGGVMSVGAGTGIAVNSSDPANPVVSATS
jgi:hypothetical protein